MHARLWPSSVKVQAALNVLPCSSFRHFLSVGLRVFDSVKHVRFVTFSHRHELCATNEGNRQFHQAFLVYHGGNARRGVRLCCFRETGRAQHWCTHKAGCFSLVFWWQGYLFPMYCLVFSISSSFLHLLGRSSVFLMICRRLSSG